MSRFKFCITVLGVFFVFLTGCWDYVEIEDRGFILGVAIDLAEETSEKLDEPEGDYHY
jgi:spore germination protein